MGKTAFRTIAEGVAHANQLEQLIALGCGFGQGFLFAKPVAAGVVSRMLRAGGINLPSGAWATSPPDDGELVSRLSGRSSAPQVVS
ncbi:MAG TPA: hypothetical protein VMP11_04720 [Verrucomicrobiae bacterium]|nr:hypothetical protein [Verrucomicrobiae bacterium]